MNKKKPPLIIAVSLVLLFTSLIQLLRTFPISQIYTDLQRGGVTTQTETVKVLEVLRDSPGEKAGLMNDDIIIAVDGIYINSTEEFISLTESKNGEEINLKIKRQGQELEIPVVTNTGEDPPKGRVGIVIGQQGLKELPLGQIIIYHLKNKFGNLRFVTETTFAIGGMIVAIGILKLKKWALYTFIAVSLYNLAALIYFLLSGLLSIRQYIPASIFSLSINTLIGLVIAIYLFRNRKLFA